MVADYMAGNLIRFKNPRVSPGTVIVLQEFLEKLRLSE